MGVFDIPEVPDEDWPLLFLALNAVLLGFLSLWSLLAACTGTPPDDTDEPLGEFTGLSPLSQDSSKNNDRERITEFNHNNHGVKP